MVSVADIILGILDIIGFITVVAMGKMVRGQYRTAAQLRTGARFYRDEMQRQYELSQETGEYSTAIIAQADIAKREALPQSDG